MVFSSLSFAVFFTVVCILMALTNTKAVKALAKGRLRRLRHMILLLASYFFYGYWNWKFCFLMLGLTAVSYLCARGCGGKRRGLCIKLGVIVPILILGIFKYYNFFVDSFCAVFGIQRLGTLKILLPVGISFYTFQSLSYTIDVYRGKIEAERSFADVALYIAFFPQLVAGPIVKAGDFIPQLHEDRNISLKGLEEGVQIFVFGLFKKLVLADNIALLVDAVYANPAEFHALTVVLAVAAYSMQIYCDFSGYSDMAVGCARALGYELCRNFNLPYLSKNVTEFWKRWHISLSTWLQEYVYIPLGGNRKGTVRTYVNLMLTMLIGGLWHGAAWTFIIWGGLHGLALVVHKLWIKHRKGGSVSAFGTACSILMTFVFVSLALVFFRAGSFKTAFLVFKAIFTWQSGVVFISSWAVFGIAVIMLAQAAAVIKSEREHKAWEGYYPTVRLDTFAGLLLFFTFVGLTLGLAYTGNNPFIYFQF